MRLGDKEFLLAMMQKDPGNVDRILAMMDDKAPAAAASSSMPPPSPRTPNVKKEKDAPAAAAAAASAPAAPAGVRPPVFVRATQAMCDQMRADILALTGQPKVIAFGEADFQARYTPEQLLGVLKRKMGLPADWSTHVPANLAAETTLALRIIDCGTLLEAQLGEYDRAAALFKAHHAQDTPKPFEDKAKAAQRRRHNQEDIDKYEREDRTERARKLFDRLAATDAKVCKLDMDTFFGRVWAWCEMAPERRECFVRDAELSRVYLKQLAVVQEAAKAYYAQLKRYEASKV